MLSAKIAWSWLLDYVNVAHATKSLAIGVVPPATKFTVVQNQDAVCFADRSKTHISSNKLLRYTGKHLRGRKAAMLGR